MQQDPRDLKVPLAGLVLLEAQEILAQLEIQVELEQAGFQDFLDQLEQQVQLGLLDSLVGQAIQVYLAIVDQQDSRGRREIQVRQDHKEIQAALDGPVHQALLVPRD